MTRDCSTRLARTCVSVTLFNELQVRGHCCRVGEQELELPVSSFYLPCVTTEHPCTLNQKEKGKKIQATAMAWKSGEG